MALPPANAAGFAWELGMKNGWDVIRERNARRQHAEENRKPLLSVNEHTGTTRLAEEVDQHVAGYMDLLLGKDCEVVYEPNIPLSIERERIEA